MAPTAADRQRRPALAVLGVVVLGLAAGVVGGEIVHATEPGAAPTSTTAVPAAATCAVTKVAREVLPDVVTIAVASASSGSTGSGEVIRADGYILTNNHVVAGAASGGSIQVRFEDGSTAAARLVGRDPLTDLAVIKVDASHKLSTIGLGSSASVRVGEQVVVLGAPLGLSSTVTSGIVSALDRTVTVTGEGSQPALLLDAVQTDAAINPGNSGGAMVDCAGRLIGVPSAGATVPSSSGESTSQGSIGLGFAIPVDLARSIADELIAKGKVTHATLGLAAEPLDPGTQAASSGPAGLLVTEVTPSGPVAEAGIRAGDVVTSVGGQRAVTTDQLLALTLKEPAGARVAVEYERAGRSAKAVLTLAAAP